MSKVELKAQAFDIAVEQEKLMKQYRELNQQKAELLKQINEPNKKT